jgi:hypothetical protein
MHTPFLVAYQLENSLVVVKTPSFSLLTDKIEWYIRHFELVFFTWVRELLSLQNYEALQLMCFHKNPYF